MEWVHISAQNGFDMWVQKNVAEYSLKLKELIANGEEIVEIPFRSDVVEKAIEYLYYKAQYDHQPDDRPSFVFSPEMAMNLIVVAHWLRI